MKLVWVYLSSSVPQVHLTEENVLSDAMAVNIMNFAFGHINVINEKKNICGFQKIMVMSKDGSVHSFIDDNDFKLS